MTEHDAPTVARATLWIDTSSSTTTRRTECLDDAATLSFERPMETTAAPPPDPVEEDVDGAPAPPAPPPAPPVETAVLDRAQLIAAIDCHVTGNVENLEPEPPLVSARPTRKAAWRSAATHALALIAGAALGATLLGAPRKQPAPALPAQAKAAAETSAPSAPTNAKDAPVAPQPAQQAAAPTTAIAQASMGRAVDALARGDYASARAEYEALAREHPNDAALGAVAAVLAARTAGCTDEARKDGSCAR